MLTIVFIALIYFDAGPKGVFWAITLAEVMIAIIGIFWFKKGKWKTVKV